MNRFCLASFLLVLFSVSCTVIFPLPVVGPKSIQNTNDVVQGDLVLSGNTNHTIIGETFHINGSIVVTGNATLYLREAILNFTEPGATWFNITLRDPLGGQPRLRAYNSTIATGLSPVSVYGYDNASTLLTDVRATGIELLGDDEATLNVSGSELWRVISHGAGVVADLFNSTIGEVVASQGTVSVRNTTAALEVQSGGVDSSMVGLGPGYYEYWNYAVNCSVTGTWYPDFTVNRSMIEGWSFRFYGSSNAALAHSIIGSIYVAGSTRLTSSDSSIETLDLGHTSRAELVNSIVDVIALSHESSVWFYWYLDVHVVDSLDEDVPMAEVSAEFGDSTLAGSAQTDDSGWARLVLLDWMQNTTAIYKEDPYRVTATYDVYFGEETVEMDWNKEITIQLPFVIPEFPLTLMVVMAASIMGVVVLLLKRRLAPVNNVRKHP